MRDNRLIDKDVMSDKVTNKEIVMRADRDFNYSLFIVHCSLRLRP